MSLTFSPEALTDIEDLHAYIAIARQSPTRAYKTIALIRIAINRLEPFPRMGREGRVAGTRELVVPRLPYVIVYSLHNDDEVTILRVLHGARQWPPP